MAEVLDDIEQPQVMEDPAKKTILIKDGRKVNAATGQQISNFHTGKYDADVVSKIVKAAKYVGVDPSTAVAIGLQETGLGKEDENYGHTLTKEAKFGKDIPAGLDWGAYNLANELKGKLDTAKRLGYKDEAMQLQAYNGYGKIGGNNDENSHILYGRDVSKTPIDMKKEPLYGKTIVDIRDNVIKKNPELVNLINSSLVDEKPVTQIQQQPPPITTTPAPTTPKSQWTIRQEGKTFIPQRPDGKGGYTDEPVKLNDFDSARNYILQNDKTIFENGGTITSDSNELHIEGGQYKNKSKSFLQLGGHSHAEGGTEVSVGDKDVTAQKGELLGKDDKGDIVVFGALKNPNTGNSFTKDASDLSDQENKGHDISAKKNRLIHWQNKMLGNAKPTYAEDGTVIDAPENTPQTPNGDPIDKYYQYLKSKGADIAPTVQSFRNTLSDPNNAQKYYSYLKQNKFDAPDTYESFANTLGLSSKKNGTQSFDYGKGADMSFLKDNPGLRQTTGDIQNYGGTQHTDVVRDRMIAALPEIRKQAVQDATLQTLKQQGKSPLVGSNDYNALYPVVEHELPDAAWMPHSLQSVPFKQDIQKSAVEDFAAANNEKPEDINQKIKDGKYVVEDGKVKEIGGFGDNFSQGVRDFVNNVGLSIKIGAAQSRGNDNEVKYVMNEFNKDKKYERETTANDVGGRSGKLLGSLSPYVAAGAVMPGADIPLMGMENQAANHQAIWSDPNLTDDQKVRAINNTSTDAMMTGALQGAAFHSIGSVSEAPATASNLLSKYAPTAALKKTFTQKLYNGVSDLLKTTPADVTKLAAIGGGTELINDLTKSREGVKVDFSNIPESALNLAALHLLNATPKVLTTAFSTLDAAKNSGYDKSNPDWYNRYSKQTQDALNNIVSAPEPIYQQAVSQLDKSPDPAAAQAKNKIQTFRDYYNSFPADVSEEAKGKALHILQLKTEATADAQNAPEDGIKAHYEQRAKTYDDLLNKTLMGDKVDEKKEPLLHTRISMPDEITPPVKVEPIISPKTESDGKVNEAHAQTEIGRQEDVLNNKGAVADEAAAPLPKPIENIESVNIKDDVVGAANELNQQQQADAEQKIRDKQNERINKNNETVSKVSALTDSQLDKIGQEHSLFKIGEATKRERKIDLISQEYNSGNDKMIKSVDDETTKEPINRADEGSTGSNEPVPAEKTGTTKEIPTETAQPTEEGEKNTVGVSHGALTKLSQKLGLPEPEEGKYWEPEEYADRGRKLLNAGADPNEVNNPKNELHDRISIARAHLEDLKNISDAMEKKWGYDSQQYKNANIEIENYKKNSTKVLGTLAHRAMVAMQGERDLDTGSFTAVKQKIEDTTKKPLTSDESNKVKELTEQNSKLKVQLDEATKNLIKAKDEEFSSKETPEKNKSFKEQAKKVADSFRKLKSKPLTFKDENGNDIPIQVHGVSWNDLVELGARAIEKTGEIADGVAAVIDKLKDADWYKKLSDNDKSNLDKKLNEQFEDSIKNTPEAKNIRRLEKELSDLKEGNAKQTSLKRELSVREKELQDEIFEEKNKLGLIRSKEVKEQPKHIQLTDKELERRALDEQLKKLHEQFEDKGNKDKMFTRDEAKSLWDYAKKAYLNKGVEYIDTIGKVATDTGLTFEQVANAFVSPTTKKISDAVWEAHNKARMNKVKTQDYVDSKDESRMWKTVKAITAVPKSISTAGHGHIYIGTHSPMQLMTPSEWGNVYRSQGKMFRSAYGSTAAYEKAVHELKNSPNYTTALKAGLKNDVDSSSQDDFERSQHILGEKAGGVVKRIGQTGERGFLGMKYMRQAMFDKFWNGMRDDEKTDDVAKEIASYVNVVTGATNVKIPKALQEGMFSAPMEAARWQRVGNIGKAIAAATKVSNDLIRGNKVSPTDKVFLKMWGTRVGQQLPMLIGMAASAQFIHNKLNPDDPINLLDPTKSNFLKIKIGGVTVDLSGGVLGIKNLLVSIAKGIGNGKNATEEDKNVGKTLLRYVRGKESPAVGIAHDLFSGYDYGGNTLPYSNKTPETGRRKLSWGEYGAEKLPIFAADAVENMRNAAEENGMNRSKTERIIDGVVATGLTAGLGIRANDYPTNYGMKLTAEDRQNPTFKYFLDKGLDLPHTDNSSVSVKDFDEKKEKHVSDYPKEIQEQYNQVHKEYLERELESAVNGGVYRDEFDKPSLTRGSKKVELNDLSKDELTIILHQAQMRATTEAKEKVFHQR